MASSPLELKELKMHTNKSSGHLVKKNFNRGLQLDESSTQDEWPEEVLEKLIKVFAFKS